MGILQGKAIVITGSGNGIGAACAKACARSGAAVVVNDIDGDDADATVSAIVADGGKAISCVADVSNWDEAGHLIESCISNFSRIDGLVNNAALLHTARIDEFDPARARSLVDVNILGPLYCTGHAVKPMLAQGSGSIVNVVSAAHLGMPTMGVYGATKGAVASMVYTWAMELAGSGVRVNALSPIAATRMGLAKGEPIPEAMARTMANMQAPEANSPVVEYLLSDLSEGVNGQLMRIFKNELQLYVHPALLLPAATREIWTAETIADVFQYEFKDRLIPCGYYGIKDLPVELTAGFNPWVLTAENA